MTKDEILKLEANPETDALIAEKVMGETKPIYVHKNHIDIIYSEKGNWYCLPDYYKGDICEWTPKSFSKEIYAAWEVVEKITDIFSTPGIFGGSRTGKFYLYYTKERALGYDANYHQAVFIREGGKDKKTVTSIGDTVPHAICKAALIAVMEE